MRIIGCIVDDHNLAFVVLAALMCIAGSMVSTTLFRRTLIADGIARVHWCFLSAVTAGAATWAGAAATLAALALLLGPDPA